MAGVPLPGGLPIDPPPGVGPDLLLLPHPVGGVLNHGGPHNPPADRPPDPPPEKKQVLKVSELSNLNLNKAQKQRT